MHIPYQGSLHELLLVQNREDTCPFSLTPAVAADANRPGQGAVPLLTPLDLDSVPEAPFTLQRDV